MGTLNNRIVPHEEFAKEYERVTNGELLSKELVEYFNLISSTFYRFRNECLEKGLLVLKKENVHTAETVSCNAVDLLNSLDEMLQDPNIKYKSIVIQLLLKRIHCCISSLRSVCKVSTKETEYLTHMLAYVCYGIHNLGRYEIAEYLYPLTETMQYIKYTSTAVVS